MIFLHGDLMCALYLLYIADDLNLYFLDFSIQVL